PVLSRSLLSHARVGDALAARAHSPTFGPRQLLRHSGHLWQGSPFSHFAASRCSTTRASHESLSLHRSYERRFSERKQPLANVRRDGSKAWHPPKWCDRSTGLTPTL